MQIRFGRINYIHHREKGMILAYGNTGLGNNTQFLGTPINYYGQGTRDFLSFDIRDAAGSAEAVIPLSTSTPEQLKLAGFDDANSVRLDIFVIRRQEGLPKRVKLETDSPMYKELENDVRDVKRCFEARA